MWLNGSGSHALLVAVMAVHVVPPAKLGGSGKPAGTSLSAKNHAASAVASWRAATDEKAPKANEKSESASFLKPYFHIDRL
jgi:hypothetical protein